MTTIELPYPERTLSPNARPHHFKLYRAKKAAKNAAWAITKAARISIPAGDVPVMIGLVFHPPTKNLPDEDNAIASMKSALDGVALALGVDDSCFRLERPVIAAPVKGGKVVVTIS